MTGSGSVPGILSGGPVVSNGERRVDGPAPFSEPEHPGRWVGGAIGAGASLVAALVADRVQAGTTQSLTMDWSAIGLLGIPIGFALGRLLDPMARSGGWSTALLTGFVFGGIAPPLGAIEILAGARFLPSSAIGSSSGPAMLVFLPFAIPLSVIAMVMTVPVGLAWAVALRLVPAGVPERLAAPRWLARLGIRHAIVVAVVVIVVAELVHRGYAR